MMAKNDALVEILAKNFMQNASMFLKTVLTKKSNVTYNYNQLKTIKLMPLCTQKN